MRAASGLFIVELAQVAVTVGLELGCGHGAVVKVEEDQAQDEDDDEQRVEVEGDGADEQLDAVDTQVLRYAGDGCSPAGNRGDHADGCGGGVDDEGELGTRDVLAVGHGAHNRANREAVEVVVDKDQHTQDEGADLDANAALDVLCGKPAKGSRAAGYVDQRDHDAQHHQEDEDAGVIGHGGHEAVVDDVVDGADGHEPRHQQAAYDDAHKQGGVGLLGDERQDDCHDWRQQRENRVGELHVSPPYAGGPSRPQARAGNPARVVAALRVSDSPQDLLLRPSLHAL